MIFRPIFLSFALLVVSLVPSARAAESAATAASTGFDDLLADAKRLLSEKSWALTRDAYAAALKLAPTGETRRWCELKLIDATWRAENRPGNWEMRQSWEKRHRTALDALLVPYSKDRARDDFWVAAMESRLGLNQVLNQGDAFWADWFTIADHLASQPPASETAARYVGFLRRTVDNFRIEISRSNLPRLVTHLDNAARAAGTINDRLWCTLASASFYGGLSSVSVEERATRWAAVLATTRGTRWEAPARAAHLVWRVQSGWQSGATPEKPLEIAPLLAEIAEIRLPLVAAMPDTSLESSLQQLDDLDQRLRQPILLLNMPPTFRSGQAVRFSLGTTGYSRLNAALYRHTLASWVQLHSGRTVHDGQNPLNATTRVRSWNISLPAAETHAWHSEMAEIASSLIPGFYTLAVTGEGTDATEQRNFVVSDIQAVLVASEKGPASLYVFKSDSGEPVAGAAIQGLVATPETSKSWSGTTDAEGMVRVPEPPPADERYYSDQIVAFVGDQPVGVRRNNYRQSPTPLIADLFVDRQLYRPGETVKWKLIVRERHNGRFAVPDTKLQLKVRLNDETLVDNTEITLNDHGTAHGEILIPATARPDSASLELRRIGDSESARATSLDMFRVDNFVPPAIEARIELVSGPGSLRPGREITVRVRVGYYSGGPVVGATVTCTFFPISVGSPPAEPGERSLLDEWQSALRKQPRTGTTDAAGVAEFCLPLSEYLVDPTLLGVKAEATPEGGQAVMARAEFSITAAGMGIDPLDWWQPRLAQPGKALEFICRVLDDSRQPRAFAGTARLVEKRWQEIWLDPARHIVTGADLAEARRKLELPLMGDLPSPWKKLHADYIETPVAEIPVKAGRDGRVAVQFTPPHAGYYQMQLVRDQKALLPGDRWMAERALTVLVADESTDSLALRPDAEYLVGPAKVSPGEPLRLLAVLPEGQKIGLITVNGEESAITRRIALRGRAGMIVIDKLPRFAGRGTARLVALQPAEQYHQDAELSFAVEDRATELTVEVAPAQPALRPGVESSVMLTARNREGNPVQAEFAFAASDESVNRLTGSEAPDELPVWRNGRVFATQASRSAGREPRELKPPTDPRIGSINEERLMVMMPDGRDLVQLSAFSVSTGEARGYYGANSIAGGRSFDMAAPMQADVPSVIMMDSSVQAIESPPSDIQIRRYFASTAFWAPEVKTDAQGEARLTFKYPDNLTQWRLSAYAVGADGNSFGWAKAFTRTSLPFQARLQTPRFLVAGDTASPSALLVNRTDTDMRASADLKVAGSVEMVPVGLPVGAHLGAPSPTPKQRAQPLDKLGALSISNGQATPLQPDLILVPKQAEARTAWNVKATQPGEANFTLTAHADAEGDAMAITLPVLEDGIQQETAASGRLAANAPQQALVLPLPEKLAVNRTTVTVQLSPGHLPAILDTLPYLVDYPYGCVEQTMSRFLPAVVVRQTLADLGLDAGAVERRVSARESKADAARRQQTAGLGKLDEVVKQSLARLVEAQRYDGFGWWPGSTSTDLWMTAYVMWGFNTAQAAGVKIPEHLFSQTSSALVRQIERSDETGDRLAWAMAALVYNRKEQVKSTEEIVAAFARLYAARERLSPSGRACLALAAHTFGSSDQQAVLLRNLENGAQRARTDDLGDTVHWGSTGGYWRAMDGAVESTALTLLALLEADPQHPLAEPAANWLTLNRRSARWASTRDTAFAVLALARYVTLREEAQPDTEVEVLANGQRVRRVKLTRESLLAEPLVLTLAPEALRPGDNRIELHRVGGKTPVYAVALASAWAASDGVKPAGHLLDVARGFIRQKAQPTLAGTLRIELQPLPSGGEVTAGEQVTAKVTLTVPNELEYLMIEVPKPAGCEPLNPLSGWDARLARVAPVAVSVSERTSQADDEKGHPIYREERDDKSVFFLDHVEAGTWEIRFGLRATTPGDYRALPVKAGAMYVPEIRANTEAQRVKIENRSD